MNDIIMHRVRQATALSAIALLAACGETYSEIAAPSSPTQAQGNGQPVDLGSCDSLKAPAGNTLSYHTYAKGTQIYRWNGTSWVFVAPSALLSADAGGRSTVGTHYAGPTWEGVQGSKVVGAVAKRCPAANTIPWLLLTAVSESGPGPFEGTTFIQRVNTTGGVAPSTPGQAVGEEAHVFYTAEYYFYRAN